MKDPIESLQHLDSPDEELVIPDAAANGQRGVGRAFGTRNNPKGKKRQMRSYDSFNRIHIPDKALEASGTARVMPPLPEWLAKPLKPPTVRR